MNYRSHTTRPDSGPADTSAKQGHFKLSRITLLQNQHKQVQNQAPVFERVQVQPPFELPCSVPCNFAGANSCWCCHSSTLISRHSRFLRYLGTRYHGDGHSIRTWIEEIISALWNASLKYLCLKSHGYKKIRDHFWSSGLHQRVSFILWKTYCLWNSGHIATARAFRQEINRETTKFTINTLERNQQLT